MLAAYGGPLDDANAIVRGLKRKPVIPHESSSEILDRIADWQELSICMGENDFSQEEKAEINSKIEKEINDFSAALTVERLIQGIGDGNSALFRDIADELEEPEGPRKRNDFLALKAFSQLPEPRTFRD
jgi:hypothetical protein